VFLRRQIGSRLRLKRVPELEFLYDESIAGQDRIEQLLNNLRAGDASKGAPAPLTDTDDNES
jgi:ribosome-binding factor A